MAPDTLAGWVLCWRIERRDGVTIGLTAHDRDLTIDGLVHRAAPGLLPSALGIGEDAEAMEASGPLTAAAITERDLLAGRWDGATVTVSMADWAAAPPVAVPLATGTLGAVAIADGRFTAQLAGPAAVLDAGASELTAPDCRAELGDRRCRVPMAGRRRIVRVAAGDGAALTLDAAEPAPNAYGNGRLRWLTGANSGLEGAVLASAGTSLMLREPPALAPAPGDRVEIVEGCDKLLATCAARFANARNFRGEPFLPGIDLLTRYPGA